MFRFAAIPIGAGLHDVQASQSPRESQKQAIPALQALNLHGRLVLAGYAARKVREVL